MGRPDRGAPVLSGSIIARRPGLSTGGRADRQAGRAFSAVGRWSGFGPAQVQTCHVGSRPTPGGSPAFSGESRKKERRGLCPLDPLLLWSARWHSLVLAWWDTLSRSLDYFGTHLRALIWGLSFAKMLCSIFSPGKCVPNRSWHTGRNSPSNGSEATAPKNQRVATSGHKTRVQGGALVFFPPAFFQRKPGPRPGPGGKPPRRC